MTLSRVKFSFTSNEIYKDDEKLAFMSYISVQKEIG